ncbi:MAG: hypothetical protein NTZ49_01365 [Candidatus Parcubacteria bacterium]|nr:hypothetical protein [Candidatus Parcubacteria bacterium]
MRKFSLLLLSLLLFGALTLPFINLAQATTDAPADTGGYGLEETGTQSGLKKDVSVPEFLGSVVGAGLALSGSIFLFLIIYGGVMIMTSAGSDRVEKGKKVITWAVIGAAILAASYAITSFIFGALSQ